QYSPLSSTLLSNACTLFFCMQASETHTMLLSAQLVMPKMRPANRRMASAERSQRCLVVSGELVGANEASEKSVVRMLVVHADVFERLFSTTFTAFYIADFIG